MSIHGLFDHLPIIGRFAIVFGLIIVLPKLAERVRLPGVVGLIGGGILIGPELLSLVNPDGTTFRLFSELGKLLLMFFAGFEINLEEFKKVGKRAAAFGFLTLLLPLLAGTGVGLFLGFSMNAAVLVGSLLASHTLLGLPVVKELGLMKNNAIMVTVGATIFTDITSMLVLAICLGIHATGFSPQQLAVSIGELAIYIPVVVFGLSWLARRLFILTRSEELRLAILLLMIVVGSLLAELIELEGIVGAFLTGIAVNRALGEEHKTGHTLGVISHALFIPAFLMGTGFLVDTRIFISTIVNHADMVILIVGGLFIGKFLAAWIFGKGFKLNKNETRLMWSLSIPQVAATLAASMVAYNAINADGERLLNEAMLNTVVVLVIVTAVVGPILTRRFGASVAAESDDTPETSTAPDTN